MKLSSSPSAVAMRKHRKGLKEQGLVPVTVHIPPECRPALKACEDALQKGILPIIPERVRSHEMSRPAWTLETLLTELKDTQAVKDGCFDIYADPINPCLRIKLTELGGVESFLSIGGGQMVVSTLLTAASHIEDRNALNEMLLKSNKIFPLSSFSIATINGEEYYELIGELSIYSSIANIVEEIDTLKENIELANELFKNYSKH